MSTTSSRRARARVVSLGSVNVDLVTRLPQLPLPGETRGGGRSRVILGGKGANKAAATAALDVESYLIACVGNDEHGRASIADLHSRGVDCTFVSVVETPTGTATILVDEAGENLIALSAGANGDLDADTVCAALRKLLAPGDVVAVDLEIPMSTVSAAASCAVGLGAVVILDPAPAQVLDDALLASITFLTPNEHEVGLLTPAAASGEAGVARLLSSGLAGLVITRGAQGVDLHRTDHPPWHHAPNPVSPVDTTGAGDAFAAGLAVALAERLTIECAVAVGAACGAHATGAAGARGALATRASLCEGLGVDYFADQDRPDQQQTCETARGNGVTR